MNIKLAFDGKVFIPDQPIDLPEGSILEITLPESKEQGAANPLLDLVELMRSYPSDPEWPEDAATQHDHYLYGTPKRP